MKTTYDMSTLYLEDGSMFQYIILISSKKKKKKNLMTCPQAVFRLFP